MEARKHDIRVTALTPSTIVTDLAINQGLVKGNEEDFLQPEDLAELMVAHLQLNKRVFVKSAGPWTTNAYIKIDLPLKKLLPYMPYIQGVTFSLSQHILKGWPNRIPYLLLSPFTTIIFYSRNTPIPDCSLKIHQLSFTTCNTSFTSIHFKAKRLLIDRSNHSFPS